MERLELKLKTLTPLWTGGADKKCDRLHETGIIGSLRWWYEALVRGLGGYACDPTSDGKCQLKGDEKTVEEIKSKLCPACFLFGCTGWKRRFRLEVTEEKMESLHFRSPSEINLKWLARLFSGLEFPNKAVTQEERKRQTDERKKEINRMCTVVGNITIKIVPFGLEKEVLAKILSYLFYFIENYGGLGAKIQHGFGIIQITQWFSGLEQVNEQKAVELLSVLKEFIGDNKKIDGISNAQWDIKRFFSLTYDLDEKGRKSLNHFLSPNSHLGNERKLQEKRYIPCSFDLRYKGDDRNNFGFRRWLKLKKSWHGAKISTKPSDWKELDKLLGAAGKRVEEDAKRSGTVFFSMPYSKESSSQFDTLRIYGFVSPDLTEVKGESFGVKQLVDLVQSYISAALGNSQLIIENSLLEGGKQCAMIEMPTE